MENENIKEIEGKVEYVSTKTNGIKINGVWINEVQNVHEFRRGDRLKIMAKQTLNGLVAVSIEKLESEEDDAVDFSTLLSKAHEIGKLEIETTLIEHDRSQKLALVKATIRLNGRIYEAHGDTSAENTPAHMQMHYIRFAETRAIARALRWATNEGKLMKQATAECKCADDDTDGDEWEE